MEVDTPTRTTATTAGAAVSSQIKIHPLAIIGISDHQTRITTGGSPLSSSTSTSTSTTSIKPSIIGLLFGYQQGNNVICIIDAEEVEYTPSSNNEITAEQKADVETKIELHQKVFPTHEVIGWYRVDLGGSGVTNNNDVNDDMMMMIEPTEDDLRINNGWMRKYNESPLFVLMDASDKKKIDDDDHNNHQSNDQNHKEETMMDGIVNDKGENARKKLDRDEQLPLSIYESVMTGAGNNRAIFVHLEFELKTFEPERIAVEEVFKTQTNAAAHTRNNNKVSVTTNVASIDETSASSNPETETASQYDNSSSSSAAAVQVQSLITSIEAMNTRVAVLIDFLHKTQTGEIPTDHGLVRQVGSLVKQLPLVTGRIMDCDSSSSKQAEKEETKMKNDLLASQFENEYDDMLIASFLGTIAKTTKAVLSYSEKYKMMNESSGWDTRRGH